MIRDWLKDQMRERGWNVARLAEQADVSIGLAAKWVSENPRYRVNPGPASCAKIAGALGFETDYVLTLAGHRPGEVAARAEVDARIDSTRRQVDEWIAAVGPEYEPFLWENLKAAADGVLRIKAYQDGQSTATNSHRHGATNPAHSQPKASVKRRRTGPDDPLTLVSRRPGWSLTGHADGLVQHARA